MEEQATPPKKKKAATAAEIGKELKRIYAVDGVPAPTEPITIERAAKKRRWPKFVIGVLLLFALSGIAWAGIMRFGGSVRYNDSVSVNIDGPAAPRSGEAATWIITYKNDERLPLAQAKLSLRLPGAVTVISADPPLIDDQALTWPIGTIAAGAEGSITLKGRVLDAVDAPLAVQALLSYRPANFNADFEKIASWSSRLADAAVEATLTAPEESVPGDSEAFTVTIKKRSDLSIDALIPDLKIRFDPDQFVAIKTVKPDFSSADARTWVSAAPGDKPLEFSVIGSFAAGVSGDTRLRAEIGTLNQNNSFILLATATAAVNVLPGDLGLTIIRNGSTTDSTANLGEKIHVSVNYENLGSKPIADTEISLTAAGTPSANGVSTVDWSTLDDLHGGKRSGNTVTWTKKEISDLGSIAPGAKGSIDLSFKTTGSVFTVQDRNYGLDLSVRSLIGSIGGKKSGKTVSTPVLRTLLNTDAAIGAAAKKLDDSTYRIVWALTNSLHEISGIKVTAQLPTGVSFQANGQIDAGSVSYDDPSHTVSWTLNRLPTSVKSVSADFTVTLAPSDQKSPLLDETMFTATDKDTDAALASSAGPLDTAGATQP